MDERCRQRCILGGRGVLALRGAQGDGETEQRESEDTDGEANEQHGGYGVRKNDCRKPKKPLNEAMCVEQELEDTAQTQSPVQ